MEQAEQTLNASKTAPPLPSTSGSLFQRLRWAVRLWIFKSVVVTALFAIRRIKSAETQKVSATYTKRYTVRSALENRVFIPKDWKPGQKLPLYIDIHGGGFAIADPQTDDTFCHYFCNTFQYCVVSLNYRKAPLHPFPAAIEDLTELVAAVLSDSDLPVDRLKPVAMGGFSAGGNLSLAVSQTETLRGKIKGVVPIYPAVDFSSIIPGDYKPSKTGKPDVLKNMAALFNWGYIPKGTDRRNPLLSPIYAQREHLPEKIFLVGAEEDVLCKPAELMANDLAKRESGERRGDEDDWVKGGIAWRKVLDQQHGFTHIQLKGEEEQRRQKVCNDLYQQIAGWLDREVYGRRSEQS